MYQGGLVDERAFSRKLEAAYVLENALSKMAAGLFIACWEKMKALAKVQEQMGEQDNLHRDEHALNDNYSENSSPPHQSHQ